MRRLVLEDSVTKEILKVRSCLSYGQCKVMMKRWFMEDGGAMDIWDDNKSAVEWLNSQLDESNSKSVLQENIHALRRDAVVNQANIILKVNYHKKRSAIAKMNTNYFTNVYY